MELIITPLDKVRSRFKIETAINGPNPTIIKYAPLHAWFAERVTMKFFTAQYISQLGALIESKKQEWFIPQMPILVEF